MNSMEFEIIGKENTNDIYAKLLLKNHINRKLVLDFLEKNRMFYGLRDYLRDNILDIAIYKDEYDYLKGFIFNNKFNNLIND